MTAASPSFCVVGAGMSGLLMAIRLKKAGYKNIKVLEKAPELGGTWFHNRYPGVACDVPSHYYTYSFSPNPDWSRKFAPGAEIRRYFKNVAEKYDLLNLIEFNTEVAQAKFDGKKWKVETSSGASFQVDYLISATGILHKASVPKIPGLETFKGPMFHSSEWENDLDLRGKKVGIIGNGSTGVQMLPRLVEKAEQVYAFQRTAQWIMPAKDKEYGPMFRFLLRYLPGFARFQYWQNKKTFEAFTNLVLEDGWQRRLVVKMTTAMLNTVKDPELKAKLTPNYDPGCKRLVMSNEFYRAMQKENIKLVTEGIEKIEEKGVVTTSGEKFDCDIIVMATGFDPRAYMRPMEMENEKGESVSDIWAEKGIKAYRTVALPDFANFFMVLGPNSPVGNFSVISAAEYQTNYILKCISLKEKAKADSIRPAPEPTELYNKAIKDAMGSTIWLTGCNSWYLDEQGNSATWPWTPKKFRKDLKKPELKDFVLN